MAMSVGPGGGDDAPMSDINTTPLVDVMLVLLIIFLITVPVVIQTVPVQLPKVSNIATATKPENIVLSVAADGSVYWGQQKIDTKDELREKGVTTLKNVIAKLGTNQLTPEQMPEVHIRADSNVPYSAVGGTIFAMQRAGFQKIAFISEPPAGSVTR